MTKTTKWIIGIVVVLVIAGIAYYYYTWNKKPAVTTPATPAATV